MLTDLQALVRSIARVPDSLVSQASGGDEERAIADAVREYSARRPRRLTASFASTGAGFYSLPVLVAGWNRSQYQLEEVLVGSGLLRVDPRLYREFATDSDIQLRFLVSPIPAGTSIYIEYQAPHRVDNSVDTIALDNPADVSAVAHLAASYVLSQAANAKAPQTDSSIDADSVDQTDQRKAYAMQASDEFKVFERLIGPRGGRTSVVVPLFVNDSERRFWSR